MKEWGFPDFEAYASVHAVLDELCTSGSRGLPLGAQARMHAALDKLRGNAPGHDIFVAETAALAIHELEWAIRYGEKEDEDRLRENLRKLGQLWQQSLPRLHAYASIYIALDQICFGNGDQPPLALARAVSSAIDTLHAAPAVAEEDLRLAERLAVALRELDWAIRHSDCDAEEEIRDELLLLFQNWASEPARGEIAMQHYDQLYFGELELTKGEPLLCLN